MAQLKALIIADPVEKLKPAGDTSLYILRDLLQKKIPTYFATAEDLSWQGSELRIRVQSVTSIERGELPILGDVSEHLIEKFSLVFIRKDPPFNSSYVKLCWLLLPFEKKIRICNRPSALLMHHEKMLPLQALSEKFLKPADLIPTCIAESFETAEEFIRVQKTEKIVMKPFFGFGGSDIFLLKRANAAEEAKSYFERGSDWIFQPFENAVEEGGDLRVFFIHGKYAGSFARLPKQGSHISNLAQGGRAQLRNLTDREKQVIAKLEKFIRIKRIDFVGADLIAEKVNELNITSPTGLVSFENLAKINLADRLIKGLLRK